MGRKTLPSGRHLLYKVSAGDRKVHISVTHRGNRKKYKPEEISSMVLKKMKETAENYIGQLSILR